MATPDDPQRKKPPLAKAVGGATGAMRVPVAGADPGSGARGGKAPPTATATKPAAFTFAMKKSPTARETPTARTGAKAFGASTSGAAGGAIRVPVFGKNPGAAATINATASAKAPFAMSIGSKAAQAKDRATSTFKIQPSMGGSFPGAAAKKPVETKSDVQLGAAREKSATPGLVLKPSTKPLQGSAPMTFGRVKIAPKQEGARAGRSQARTVATVLKDGKTPRFQLKLSRAASKTEISLAATTTKVNKLHPVSATSARTPTADTRSEVQKTAPNAASMQKKRVLATSTQVAASPAKKPRTETKLPAPALKTTQELNIVSPEPQARHQTSVIKESVELASTKDDETEIHAESSLSESAVGEPVCCMMPSRTSENIVKHLEFDSNTLTASSLGVFVTSEEEELASFTVDARAIETESEGFLQRVRGLQLFVDDVDKQKSLVCNELLDANALVSECLLDIIADATALQGGVKLLELDELSAVAQQQYDNHDPHVVAVAFPW